MNRALRRYHARRAKLRKWHRIWRRSFIKDADFENKVYVWKWPTYAAAGGNSPLHWWQRNHSVFWPVPKCWDVEMHIRPARSRSNRLLHLIELGRDEESLHFPNYRKPHIYYW